MAQITVVDLSRWNRSDKAYFKLLKDKGIKSAFVQLTVGNNAQFDNPVASAQINGAIKAFSNVGVYHYYYGNGSSEAKYFINHVKSFGLDKTTPLMVDVEDSSLSGNQDAGVQSFIDYCYNDGYHNLWVYTMDSWISVGKLHVNSLKRCLSWIADYGVNPSHTWYAWQYTDNFEGLKTDASYFDTKHLFENVKEKEMPTYIKPNDAKYNKYQIIAKYVNVYVDEELNRQHGIILAKDTTIYGTTLQVGKTTRIKTSIGYITGNEDYVKLIKAYN